MFKHLYEEKKRKQGSIASVVGRYLLKRKTTLRMFAKDAGARVFSTISLPPFYYTFLQRERAKKTAPRHHLGRKAESFWLEKVAAAAVEQQQFGSNYYARGKCSPSSPSSSKGPRSRPWLAWLVLRESEKKRAEGRQLDVELWIYAPPLRSLQGY